MVPSKPWFKRPTFLAVLGVVVLISVLGAALLAVGITQAAPEQPFPYAHKPHIEAGMQCLFCHPGAMRGQSAGLPTKAKCQGCHANMAADTDLLKAWVEYANSHEEIEWTPVALQPDFVYFSHHPHIAAGVACEECHGNIGQMQAAEPIRGQNMGWCLDCHRRMAPQNYSKLSDCSTCHD